MIDRAKRIIKNAVLGVREVEKEKATGVHIYRPLYNAQEWADWLVAAGVPEPKGADDLKVSILTIAGQYQLVPNTDAHVFRTESCVFGVYAGKLCVMWYDYGYYDRHWTLRETVGYDCCCPSRALMVVSDAPGDFIFPDESLLTVPRNIALSGEKSEPLDPNMVQIVKSAPKEHVTPTSDEQEKAKAALVTAQMDEEASPLVLARLYEISKGHPMNVGEAVAELGADIAKDLGLGEPEPTVTIQKAERTARKIKSDEDKQIIYVWASVSSKDGEQVVDYHDDTIDNAALHDACHLIVKGQRSGAFEHDGVFVNEIVSAVVLDKSMQKALSAFSTSGEIELDREGLLLGIHVPDRDHWLEVKDQDWEASINATAFVEERA